MSSARHLLFLGDSHVRYFAKASVAGMLYPNTAEWLEVGGATAVGMRNPNSKTDAIGRFRKWIADKDRASVVIMHLGEVDCGYVVWHRAERYHEPIETQMLQSLDAYFEFVDELLGEGFSHVIITGATLPTITDDDQTGEVVEARSAITATQAERTALTLEYNRLLAEGARSRKLPFVDIADDVIDSATGVVAASMRNSNPQDHHMNVILAAAHWTRRLEPALGRTKPRGGRERRQWQATRDTYLKGYPAHSARIPADLLVQVSAGDVIDADFITQQDDNVFIRNVRYGRESFPLIRVLQSRHFKPVN